MDLSLLKLISVQLLFEEYQLPTLITKAPLTNAVALNREDSGAFTNAKPLEQR